MRGPIAALLMALVSLVPASAFAQSSWLYELRGGVLAHDVPIVAGGHWENGVSLNAEAAFTPSLPFLGGNIRPVVGGTFTTGQATSWVYADARLEWAWSRYFVGIGVGPSIHSGDSLYISYPQNKALGSRVLFHVPLEIGFQFTPQNRIELYYEHESNAFLAYPNPGMDNIGARIAHRF